VACTAGRRSHPSHCRNHGSLIFSSIRLLLLFDLFDHPTTSRALSNIVVVNVRNPKRALIFSSGSENSPANTNNPASLVSSHDHNTRSHVDNNDSDDVAGAQRSACLSKLRHRSPRSLSDSLRRTKANRGPSSPSPTFGSEGKCCRFDTPYCE
jgi:hypothetical protein